MSLPVFVAEYPTAYNNGTSPKTAMSAVAVESGDLLVAVAFHETNVAVNITEDGSSSWVLRQTVSQPNLCYLRIWTYEVTSNENITVTFTSSSGYFGGNVLRFNAHGGVGTSNSAYSHSGDSEVILPSVSANSTIVMISADWIAQNGDQVANTTIGDFTYKTGYPGDNVRYGILIGYYPDSGSSGSKTIGQIDPDEMEWTVIGLEIKSSVLVTPVHDRVNTRLIGPKLIWGI